MLHHYPITHTPGILNIRKQHKQHIPVHNVASLCLLNNKTTPQKQLQSQPPHSEPLFPPTSHAEAIIGLLSLLDEDNNIGKCYCYYNTINNITNSPPTKGYYLLFQKTHTTTRTQSLNCLLINAQSLSKNKHHIYDLLVDNQPTLLLITKSWLRMTWHQYCMKLFLQAIKLSHIIA